MSTKPFLASKNEPNKVNDGILFNDRLNVEREVVAPFHFGSHSIASLDGRLRVTCTYDNFVSNFDTVIRLDPDARSEIVHETNTSVDVRTFSRSPSFLILGDYYYPGWRAEVNGIPAHVFQTNYIQRGVLLPSGANRVHFEFHPLSFYLGMAISIAGVVLSIAAALVAFRRGVL